MKNVSMILGAMQVNATANNNGSGIPGLPEYWKKSTIGECHYDCADKSGTFKGAQFLKWDICPDNDQDCIHMSETKAWESCDKVCNRKCSLDTNGSQYTPLRVVGDILQCNAINDNSVEHGTVQFMKCHNKEALPAKCNDGTWEFEQPCKNQCTVQAYMNHPVVTPRGDLDHQEYGSALCKIVQKGLIKTVYDVPVTCSDGLLKLESEDSCQVPCEHERINQVWPFEEIQCKSGYTALPTSRMICQNADLEAKYFLESEVDVLREMNTIEQVCFKQCTIYKAKKVAQTEHEYGEIGFMSFPVLRKEGLSQKVLNHNDMVEVQLFNQTFPTTCTDGKMTLSEHDLKAHKKNFQYYNSKRRNATTEEGKLKI